ncbi:hypothetical protein [Nannocystis pusilla]|uniref:hypothetical protein n=1 Tax=Nannocystis pusilla TaxID=889268 RepID=UPI003BF010A7
MILTSLFMLPLLSGCDDNKGGASASGSTSGEDTTGNSMTDGSPTEGGTGGSDSTTGGGTTGGGTTGGGTGSDGTTGDTSGSDGTTGGSGDASLCQDACDKLVSCELEENVRECLSWCDPLVEDVSDPSIFPGCAALVEDFLECVAEEPMCFERDPCSGLDVAIEEQCSCGQSAGGAIDGSECTYEEECGSVSREVHCFDGTCICEVNGEDVGECQAQAKICGSLDQGAGFMAIAAGECCGWEPFELGD